MIILYIGKKEYLKKDVKRWLGDDCEQKKLIFMGVFVNFLFN